MEVVVEEEEAAPVVQTAGGAVRGRLEAASYSSSGFYSFVRVPYARPPVGALRFRPPVPVEPWDGILDGTHSPEVLDRVPSWLWSTEDCLYVNVRTKTIKPSTKFPVMVWIGGMGFALDYTHRLGVGMLTDEDVVIVTFGYRIGPFGFLALCEESAPGNCGLKDVVMALKWIRSNISFFGGDPSNITLFGTSSGAAVIHYMMLSPMGTGLFHKAILQSGCALNTWAISRNPINSIIILARELGITAKDPFEIVEILRKLPEQEILDAFVKKVTNDVKEESVPMLTSWFRPCIETEFEGQPAFITKTPSAIIKSGRFNKVPFIIGGNKMEGLAFKLHIDNLSVQYDLFNKNLQMVVPKEFRYDNDPRSACLNIGQKLMRFYVHGDKITEETTDQYCQFLTDYYFLYFINRSVKYHIEYGKDIPFYYYVFDFHGDWAFPKDLQILNTPTHCGELPYLFNARSEKYGGSRDSIRTRQRVIRLWTNFAKFGNPTPDVNDELLQITWDPVTDKNKLNYLNIGSELTKGWNPFFERMSFWDNLLDETTLLRISTFFHDNHLRALY